MAGKKQDVETGYSPPVPTRDITEKELNAVYTERNKLLSLTMRLATRCGFHSGLREDPEGETGFKQVAFIDLPTGQVSWHIPDEELSFFDGLPSFNKEYDGHSSEEKYERLLKYGR